MQLSSYEHRILCAWDFLYLSCLKGKMGNLHDLLHIELLMEFNNVDALRRVLGT